MSNEKYKRVTPWSGSCGYIKAVSTINAPKPVATNQKYTKDDLILALAYKIAADKPYSVETVYLELAHYIKLAEKRMEQTASMGVR
ncbi:hypothetical protein [Culicoidibacter larvae]|uniref:Uncharacterized protein n=1 Tax=Culicoidibacter larvae TaxID=2579976 RepID=A0A5R8Q7I8_9FIRM|nr:hypothetical protein [Culicoidibacter larvae]TLG71391.1 hypothetical protein FEZ08_10885 [Culicoidibacter larvae]